MSVNLNSILQVLVPKDKKCFPLFQAAVKNAVRTARVLKESFEVDSVKRMQMYAEIHDLEHVGDDLTDALKLEVEANFNVPFDREEVYQLAIVIDDIVDDIYGVSKRIELYKIHNIPSVFGEMSSVIWESTIVLEELMEVFKKFRYSEEARKKIANIRELERKMDALQETAIAKLFSEGADPIELIKQQEVFGLMARAEIHCEEAASIIEEVLVKFN
jgi:predicted phosphate transport protein (TIGR00153 family)